MAGLLVAGVDRRATLRKLRQENMLDATRRVKVSRPEVRSLILRSVFLYPFGCARDAQFGQGNGVDSVARLF